MALKDTVILNAEHAEENAITLITKNIQEIRIIKYFEGASTKYRVQLTVVSGRSYFLLDNTKKSYWDTQAEAEAVRTAFINSLSN